MRTLAIACSLVLVAACGSSTGGGESSAAGSTGGTETSGHGTSTGSGTSGESTSSASGSSGTDTGTPPGSYPPIHIVFNAHGHNYAFPPGTDPASPEFAMLKAQRYQAHRAEVIWLRDTTESFGAKMSFQLNGEYARDARIAGDAEHIAELPGRGHSVGTHFHRYVFTGMDEYWRPYTQQEATADLQSQTWADHIGEVEAALGAEILRVDGATASQEQLDIADTLLVDYGVGLAAGGEALTYTDWAIPPWNPFRRAFGTRTSEDPAAPVVALGGYSQIGLPMPMGLHAMLTTVPQLERHFLMLLAEWREHERRGDPPKIWHFAFMTHPDQNAAYHDEVVEFLEFLSAYTEAETPRGTPVARFATDEEVLEAFLDWEAEHPGVSSFDFDYEAHLAGRTQPFPYALEGVVSGLKDCEVVGAPITTWEDQGVVVFPMARREVLRGPPNEYGQREILSVGDLVADVYLAWSDAGAPVTIDLSDRIGATAYVKDGRTGEITMVAATAVEIPETPVVLSDTSDGL